MMACIPKPKNHTDRCSFCNGHEPAIEHVHWGAGCANLCRRHAKQVARSARRQHRTVETYELKGQQTLPGIAS
jgi:hypothetical protein